MLIPPRFVWILALLLAAVPAPAWAQCADGDGDGLCDDVDPCTNLGNVVIGNAYLRLRKVLGNQATRIFFVGTLTVPSDPPIDPMSNGMRLIVGSTTAEDPLVATDTIDVTLPGGGFDPITDRGWSVGDSGAYLYRDQHGAHAGIMRALVKQLDSGQLKVLLFGQAGTYPVPHQPPGGTIRATLVVDTPMATTGQCGEATLGTCLYRNQGRKLLCD
jgi:hypothetical protein